MPWGSEGARSISTGTAPEKLRRRKRRNLKNSRWDAVTLTWREGVLGGGNGRAGTPAQSETVQGSCTKGGLMWAGRKSCWNSVQSREVEVLEFLHLLVNGAPLEALGSSIGCWKEWSADCGQCSGARMTAKGHLTLLTENGEVLCVVLSETRHGKPAPVSSGTCCWEKNYEPSRERS